MDMPFGYIAAIAAAIATFALVRRLLYPQTPESRAEEDRLRARRRRERLERQHAGEAAQRQAASSVSRAINDVVPLSRAQAGSLATLLQRAGYPSSSAPTWWAITILMMVAGAAATLVALPPSAGIRNARRPWTSWRACASPDARSTRPSPRSPSTWRGPFRRSSPT